MGKDTLLERLRDEGGRRAGALEEARLAMAEITALAPAALQAGATKVQVADAAGISRPTLDEILR